MEFDDLIYEKKDHIATITLHNPEKLNAMTGRMLASFSRAIELVSEPVVLASRVRRHVEQLAATEGAGSVRRVEFCVTQVELEQPAVVLSLRVLESQL